MERRRALDGSLPAAHRPRAAPARRCPADDVVRRARTPARASRRCRPRWRSPACCATWPATRSSARASCRSSPTRPARSAWTRCSTSSRSTPPQGQQYEPVDHDLLLSYTEAPGRPDPRGGHHRGRRRWRSFTAAGTAYATRGVPMVPFFIFYSMFGFQRVGDLIWAAADARARGFLLGATAGRTTLLGEGLQHQDGHSLRAGLDRADRARPTTRRSPTRWRRSSSDGIERMYGARAPRTSSTTSPSTTRTTSMPADARRRRPTGIVDGLYRWADGARRRRRAAATILFSGSAHRRGPRGRRPSWPSTTTSAPSCGRATSYKRAARGGARRSSAGTACTPTEPPRTPLRHRAARRRRRARSSPSPTS